MLYCLGKPFDRMVRRLEKVETRYIEVLDEGLHALNKKRVAVLNQIGKSRNIEFTVHAPFADINIASPTRPILTVSFNRLKESMACAYALNAKLWIFHPGNKTGISTFYPGEDWKRNIRTIHEMHKTAEEYGLNIAVENLPEKYGFLMKQPKDFIKFYKETNLNDIGIALDVGHANLEGKPEQFLMSLPDKIVHMHISDNKGENDEHLGIGNGTIDWQRFAETLQQIEYDKNIMIESVQNVNESLHKMRQLLA